MIAALFDLAAGAWAGVTAMASALWQAVFG